MLLQFIRASRVEVDLVKESQPNETKRDNNHPILHQVGERIATDCVVVGAIGREVRGRETIKVVVWLSIVGEAEIRPFVE